MAGHFELIDTPGGGYRVGMLDGDGALMAGLLHIRASSRAKAGIAWPGKSPEPDLYLTAATALEAG